MDHPEKKSEKELNEYSYSRSKSTLVKLFFGMVVLLLFPFIILVWSTIHLVLSYNLNLNWVLLGIMLAFVGYGILVQITLIAIGSVYESINDAYAYRGRINEFLPKFIDNEEIEKLITNSLVKLAEDDKNFEVFLRDLPESLKEEILLSCSKRYNKTLFSTDSDEEYYLRALIKRLEKVLN